MKVIQMSFCTTGGGYNYSRLGKLPKTPYGNVRKVK